MIAALLLTLAAVLPLASGHASIFHPSMYGFNVTDKTFPYDNRPVAPLTNYTFDQWWFHGHLDYPPNPGDIFELPAGKPATTEISCDKGATTWFNSSQGGDVRQGDSPCPNSSPAAYHTSGFSDLKGCALAIAYESDVTKIQPENFTVFSVNQTCVWTRFTDFQVPERMPPCPPGGCHCAWFWIHSQDSGGEQNYMTGFKCNVTGSTSDVPLAAPQVPRRCGADPDNGKNEAAPGNCTYGAKQPLYWFQQERNNMFEGTYSPPFYLDLYNFKDGAQDDIFVDSYPNGIPPPSPNSTVVPTPFLGNGVAPAPTSVSASYTYSYGSSSAASLASTSVTSGSSIPASSASSSIPTSSQAPSSSASLSASTLPQTASPSSAAITFSSSLSPELPLSTGTVSPSSVFAPSATPQAPPPQTGSVTTATAVSTLVVTVTAGAPATSVTAVSSSFAASSSIASSAIPSASEAFSSSAPLSSSSSGSARTTIFLNNPAPASSATASVSASGSASAQQAAPTVALDFAAKQNGSARAGVLAAAASTSSTCKRQFKRKVSLRRRAVDPSELEARDAQAPQREPVEEGTILSRIDVLGLRRHRKLQTRGSLWHFF
ncbi:hypothetical protein C2E23DRAFT_907078 [Lenzites betulinus]|nr:hypothetical protein C2E23DRAFT_907078 [Lenzites betulinus]